MQLRAATRGIYRQDRRRTVTGKHGTQPVFEQGFPKGASLPGFGVLWLSSKDQSGAGGDLGSTEGRNRGPSGPGRSGRRGNRSPGPSSKGPDRAASARAANTAGDWNGFEISEGGHAQWHPP